MAYPEVYSTMIDLISQKLQDTGNAVFSDAELNLAMNEGLREVAKYQPYIYRCEFNLESRTGTATSTTASALVDSSAQFLAGDVGKWIYNETDRTWAVVTAFVSTSQLTLSKDIMVSGEKYQMFNKECTDSKEININADQSTDGALGSRAFDWLSIAKIEYPILQDPPSYLLPEEWELQENNIIRLKVSDEPDDSADADAEDEVWVYFALQHYLSRLTTLLGKIDLVAGYAAGVTTIHVDDMLAGEIIYKGQMFKIDNVRGIYIADYQRTLTGGESDVTFFPPLMDATVDDTTVRFISNTMSQKLEGIFADLVAGEASISKGRSFIPRGGAMLNSYMTWGIERRNSALARLRGIARPAPVNVLFTGESPYL